MTGLSQVRAERLERALARAEGTANPGKPETRLMLAVQDRRVLAAEVRRLRAQVELLMKARAV